MSKAYRIDMDGVLITGRRAIAGATVFLDRLRAAEALFLLLTNNSAFTSRDQMETILVLSGVTRREAVEAFADRPI